MLASSRHDSNTPRSLSWPHVTGFGVGSTIGAGIFVIAGTAAKECAGPAVSLSFFFAGLTCLLTSFCFCELGTLLPGTGSTYLYSYVSMGELVAWVIASVIARGWAGYLHSLFHNFGIDLPMWMIAWDLPYVGKVNLLSAVIVLVITAVVCFGLRESANFNLFVTVFNIALLFFIISCGAFYVDSSNWDNFFPFGVSGMLRGSAIVFFAFLGFDSIPVLAQQVKNPRRDLPLGMSITLIVVFVLYSALSLVLTGMVRFDLIVEQSPLSSAFTSHGVHWAASVIAVGSVSTISAALLCTIIAQSFVSVSVAQDGLLFRAFQVVNKKTSVPTFAAVFTGLLASVLALLFDINALADTIVAGTLLTFAAVCMACMLLRYATAENNNMQYSFLLLIAIGVTVCVVLIKLQFDGRLIAGIAIVFVVAPSITMAVSLSQSSFLVDCFRTPLFPWLPLLALTANVYFMFDVEWNALLRLTGCLLIGLFIYFAYGIRHSKLATQLPVPTIEEEEVNCY